jgi:polar amino acid transport system substrate-binding protein
MNERRARCTMKPRVGNQKEISVFMRRTLFPLLGLYLVGVFTAFARTAPESTIRTIEKRGTMMVGLSTFVPWAMRDKNGNLVGFEVDVANKLAKDLGVKLELVPTAWDGIIPALLSGKFDVIIGGMTITTQRNLTVNFTTPYEYSGTSLAVSKAMQNGFSLAALNSPNITISCRRATTACTNAAEYFPKARLREFDDESAVAQEVLNSNANAFAASEPLPSLVAAEHPDKVFTPLSQEEEMNRLPAGMAVRQGDVDTLNVLDNWIAANARFLRNRAHYWFQTQDWRASVGSK